MNTDESRAKGIVPHRCCATCRYDNLYIHRKFRTEIHFSCQKCATGDRTFSGWKWDNEHYIRDDNDYKHKNC